MNDEAIHEAVVQAAALTAQAMQAGRKLMVCGNGGSAADSSTSSLSSCRDSP